MYDECILKVVEHARITQYDIDPQYCKNNNTLHVSFEKNKKNNRYSNFSINATKTFTKIRFCRFYNWDETGTGIELTGSRRSRITPV